MLASISAVPWEVLWGLAGRAGAQVAAGRSGTVQEAESWDDNDDPFNCKSHLDFTAFYSVAGGNGPC